MLCQGWDLNPRSFELRPERSALDRSATLTYVVVRAGFFANIDIHVVHGDEPARS